MQYTNGCFSIAYGTHRDYIISRFVYYRQVMTKCTIKSSLILNVKLRAMGCGI